MKEQNNLVQVHIKLSADLGRRLNKLASEAHRSRSNQAETLLISAIEAEEKRRKEGKAA